MAIDTKSTFSKVNPIWTWNTTSNLIVNLGASIKDWVKKGEDTAKVTQEQKTKDFFAKRQQINNDITTGKITSWSVAQDTLTVRKNNLVQLFAADALEKGANPDKVVAITKKPDEVLKRLTSLWEAQAEAVNDYLMKWWYADRVFDYVIGKTNSPTEEYLTKEEKNAKEHWFWKGVDKVNDTPIGNVIMSALSVPIQTVTNLSSRAFDKGDEKDLEEYNKFLSTVSTDEYKKYKSDWGVSKFFNELAKTWLYNSWEAPNYEEWNKTFINAGTQSRADFYEWYDEALERGFNGSVEDYANYMSDMANQTIVWVAGAVKNFLETKVYEPEGLSSKVGILWWEIAEMSLPPGLALKALNKFGFRWKLIRWAINLGLDWLEFQALDDAYNKEVSDFWKYTTAATWNIWLWWIFKWLGSWLSRIPAKQTEAIATKTTKEWKEMSKITDAWNEHSNQSITPYTKIMESLDKAKKETKNNRLTSWKKLEEARKWLTYWEKEYTARDVLQDIQNAFVKLKEDWTWGEQALLPEFTVSKNWRTLTIKNKNVLNTVTKWDSKQIKLWDEIENLWKVIFKDTDKQINAQTTDEFIRGIKEILKDEWWNWASWEWLRTVRSALETIDDKFENSLTKESASEWKKARKASQEDMDIDKLLDETANRLKKWSNVNSFSQSEMEQLFTKIKEDTNIDLNNEIWAWLLNVSLRDPKKAQQLLETIYPSEPWAVEFIMKSFMNRAKRQWSIRYTSDFTPGIRDKIVGTLPWRIWGTMFGWL